MLSEAPKIGPEGRLQLHASTVAINGRAVALSGPSGCGKSALAFALLSRGAGLIADDVTWLETTPNGLVASCPPALQGRIEARGIGILAAKHAVPAPLTLIVDLGTAETDRIPQPKHVELAGHSVELLHHPAIPHFADALWHYMLHGRAD